MKATDLMLGDWVTHINALKAAYFYPIKITSLILPDRIAGYHPHPAIEGSDVYREDDLAGIPLTPEILEKNGFEDISYKRKKLETEHDFFVLQKGADGENLWWWELFFSPILPINNVHELQHALRLCGIEKEIEV